MNSSKFLNLLAVFGAMILAAPVHAQTNLLSVGGTIADSPEGGRWAYLFWRADDPALFFQGPYAGATFEVHASMSKIGGGAPFERVASMKLQTDTRTINSIIERSVHVGQDLADLEKKIDSMFAPILSSTLPSLPDAADFALASKLGVLLAVAPLDREVSSTLSVIGLAHPAIEMARGHAIALPIPAQEVTYEIRLIGGDGQALGVVGRVSLNGAGEIPLLPAPDRPVEVPVFVDAEPADIDGIEADDITEHRQIMATRTADRVARLRWATPPDLRRVGVLVSGFSMYRVERAFAESKGWDVAPPSQEVLQLYIYQEQSEAIVRVNPDIPIVPDVELDGSEVLVKPGDAADSDVVFFVDDQRLDFIGQNPEEIEGEGAFPNGSQFYYFVAARDVLGRDGHLSEGTLVTMTYRLPPDQAADGRIANEYVWNPETNLVEQRLRLRWSPVESKIDPPGDIRYHVFRWPTNDSQFRWLSRLNVLYEDDGRLYGRVSPPEGLSFPPGVEPEFLDVSLDAPDMSVPRQTFWYTIVTSEEVVEGAVNLSGHSAPIDGHIRELFGPATPQSDVMVHYFTPQLTHTGTQLYAIPVIDQVPNLTVMRLKCTRPNERGISWVEFRLGQRSLGRLEFPRNSLTAEITIGLTRVEVEEMMNEAVFISARAGSDFGHLMATPFVNAPNAALTPLLQAGYVEFGIEVAFDASLVRQDIPLSLAGDDGVFLSEDPDTGLPLSTGGDTEATPGMNEWRVYRRIDDGPLVRVANGYHDDPEAAAYPWVDNDYFENSDRPSDPIDPPFYGGRVCYYIQSVDVDLNASPFEIICYDLPPILGQANDAAPQRPVIRSIEPLGNNTEGDPARFRITWAGSREGVRRFNLVVNDGGIPPVSYANPFLGSNMAPEGIRQDGSPGLAGRYPIYTGNADIPTEDGLFAVEIPVRPGRLYQFTIESAARSNRQWFIMAASDPMSEVWFGEADTLLLDPDVIPWEQRPFDVDEDFLGEHLHARFIEDVEFQGGAVRVGRMNGFGSFNPPTGTPKYSFFNGHRDANELTFRHETMEKIKAVDTPKRPLPCVLYRYRVPPDGETNPAALRSADFVQVTPLIEEIAIEHALDDNDDPITIVRDTFIRLIPNTTNTAFDVYLVDHHPVIRGERYRYVLVRFTPNREIDRIVPIQSLDHEFKPAFAVTIPES